MLATSDETGKYFVELSAILKARPGPSVIAMDEFQQIKVCQPAAFALVSRFKPRNQASVLVSLNSLLKMGLIYREKASSGNIYYGIYDVLFARWVS